MYQAKCAVLPHIGDNAKKSHIPKTYVQLKMQIPLSFFDRECTKEIDHCYMYNDGVKGRSNKYSENLAYIS